MGIFSKIFHMDKLDLHGETKLSNNEKIKQY